MPGYTMLLGEFLKLYYFVYQDSPNNYDMFMSIYDELDDKTIRNTIFDYYMLDQKKPNIEVIDILNTQFLLGVAGKVQVETEMELVRPLKTSERFEEFEREVDEAIQSQIAQVLATAN